MDQDVDLSLLVAATGAEVIERFFNTQTEMQRRNWPANLAAQVYRAMRTAELTELQLPAHTAPSAQAGASQRSDRAR